VSSFGIKDRDVDSTDNADSAVESGIVPYLTLLLRIKALDHALLHRVFRE
jgi:hypothetical protein